MSQRREFVELAQAEVANKRGLCRRFGISPTTGHKWFGRFRERSEAGLVDLPRRPHHSPARTPAQVEQAVSAAGGVISDDILARVDEVCPPPWSQNDPIRS